MIGQPARLVAVGSVVGQLTLVVESAPLRGGEIHARKRYLQAGGGFVALASASTLGLPAALGGRVGSGPISMLIRSALERHGITRLLPDIEGDQGFSVCVVEDDGEESYISAPGVETPLTASDLDRLGIRPDDAVLIRGADVVRPDMAAAIAQWCESPGGLGEAMLAFDTGPMVPEIPDDALDRLLSRADLVLVGSRDLRLITGVEDPQPPAAARVLLESMSADAVVVVRSWSSGSWLVRRGREPLSFTCHRTADVDPSVATEVFTGSLVAEYARLGDLEQAAWHATVAASITRFPTDPSRSVAGPDPSELAAAVEAAATVHG